VVGYLISPAAWERMLECLEDLEDLEAIHAAASEPTVEVSLDDL
jgi:hypothetical protein